MMVVVMMHLLLQLLVKTQPLLSGHQARPARCRQHHAGHRSCEGWCCAPHHRCCCEGCWRFHCSEWHHYPQSCVLHSQPRFRPHSLPHSPRSCSPPSESHSPRTCQSTRPSARARASARCCLARRESPAAAAVAAHCCRHHPTAVHPPTRSWTDCCGHLAPCHHRLGKVAQSALLRRPARFGCPSARAWRPLQREGRIRRGTGSLRARKLPQPPPAAMPAAAALQQRAQPPAARAAQPACCAGCAAVQQRRLSQQSQRPALPAAPRQRA